MTNFMPKTVQKFRYPILKNIEYFDILKNKGTLKSYKTSECEGLTWRQMQLKVGSDLGAGNYRYSFKVINDDQFNNGSLRAISSVPPFQEKDNDSFKSELESLKLKINSLGQTQNSGIGIDVILSMQKTGYETQINFLNNQIAQKENFISKLEQKIEDQENDLDNASDLIKDLESKTGINQYLELAQVFLKGKIGGTKPIASLKDSDRSDIPESILVLLGTVEWSQVEKDIIDQIVNYLNLFLPKLPLKGV